MAKEMNMEALKASIALLDKKAKMANERAKADGNYAPWMEKLNEILADEAICKKLLAAESTAEARSVIAENGLEMTEEAVDAFGEYVVSISKRLLENNGELSEEDLEGVAGGILGETAVAAGYSFILNASVISSGVGATASVGSAASAGAAAGTAGFPVVGTIVGAAVAAAAVAGYIYRDEIASGLKKVGSWIKSWF